MPSSTELVAGSFQVKPTMPCLRDLVQCACFLSGRSLRSFKNQSDLAEPSRQHVEAPLRLKAEGVPLHAKARQSEARLTHPPAALFLLILSLQHARSCRCNRPQAITCFNEHWTFFSLFFFAAPVSSGWPSRFWLSDGSAARSLPFYEQCSANYALRELRRLVRAACYKTAKQTCQTQLACFLAMSTKQVATQSGLALPCLSM